MRRFNFRNPSTVPADVALWQLLQRVLSPAYSVTLTRASDSNAPRAGRTPQGTIEGELFDDCSGLAVSCNGVWLLLNVGPTQGAAGCPE